LFEYADEDAGADVNAYSDPDSFGHSNTKRVFHAV
jgi:hypothetical protein